MLNRYNNRGMTAAGASVFVANAPLWQEGKTYRVGSIVNLHEDAYQALMQTSDRPPSSAWRKLNWRPDR